MKSKETKERIEPRPTRPFDRYSISHDNSTSISSKPSANGKSVEANETNRWIT